MLSGARVVTDIRDFGILTFSDSIKNAFIEIVFKLFFVVFLSYSVRVKLN